MKIKIQYLFISWFTFLTCLLYKDFYKEARNPGK
jgi:hypothetical protein